MNKKSCILIFYVFIFLSAKAQIGINTKTPLGVFHVDPLANTNVDGSTGYEDDIIVDNAGNVGIGTTTPQQRLHIKTNGEDIKPLRINDGTQGENKYLVSDDNGLASWADLDSRNAVLFTKGNGKTLYLKNDSTFLNTGATISLSPGRWVLLVNIFLQTYGVPNTIKPKNAFSVSVTFADSATVLNAGKGLNAVATPDLEGSKVITYTSSAANPDTGGTGFNGPITSSIIIRNTSTATKKYYVMMGNVETTEDLPSTYFGNLTGWGEDIIIGFSIPNN